MGWRNCWKTKLVEWIYGFIVMRWTINSEKNAPPMQTIKHFEMKTWKDLREISLKMFLFFALFLCAINIRIFNLTLANKIAFLLIEKYFLLIKTRTMYFKYTQREVYTYTHRHENVLSMKSLNNVLFKEHLLCGSVCISVQIN